jgi:hypothetical protein
MGTCIFIGGLGAGLLLGIWIGFGLARAIYWGQIEEMMKHKE